MAVVKTNKKKQKQRKIMGRKNRLKESFKSGLSKKKL